MERRVIVRGRLRAARGGGRTVRVHRPVDPDDPFLALLDAWLDPAMPAARWAVVVGADGDADAALHAAAARRELLIVRTGSDDADALLADLSPVLGRLLDDLTSSQRRLARLLLIEGVRQADAAELLGISRASVSVANGRARIHEIGLQLRAMRACWAAGRAMSGAADVAGAAR
jgi:DNA-directed RNA polymerase specialized sigma24 family protein